MEQQNAGAPAQRPTFLTVLCILSFIWQGIVAILIILAAMVIGAVAVVANEGVDMMEAEGVTMTETTTESAGNGLAYAGVVVGLICVVLSFIGVLRMWKLKKSGFFLYAAAFAISAIMGFIDGNWTTFGLIFGAAFVGMYAMNLKHMN